MKRRIMIVLIVIAFISVLIYAFRGNQSLKKVIGKSNIYSEKEIESAMECAIDYFNKNFKGCTLRKLCYDEKNSLESSSKWAKQYEEEETIVLTSSFDVDWTGGDGSLNANSTYDGWMWILTRSNKGTWTLRTWGY